MSEKQQLRFDIPPVFYVRIIGNTTGILETLWSLKLENVHPLSKILLNKFCTWHTRQMYTVNIVWILNKISENKSQQRRKPTIFSAVSATQTTSSCPPVWQHRLPHLSSSLQIKRQHKIMRHDSHFVCRWATDNNQLYKQLTTIMHFTSTTVLMTMLASE